MCCHRSGRGLLAGLLYLRARTLAMVLIMLCGSKVDAEARLHRPGTRVKPEMRPHNVWSGSRSFLMHALLRCCISAKQRSMHIFCVLVLVIWLVLPHYC